MPSSLCKMPDRYIFTVSEAAERRFGEEELSGEDFGGRALPDLINYRHHHMRVCSFGRIAL